MRPGPHLRFAPRARRSLARVLALGATLLAVGCGAEDNHAGDNHAQDKHAGDNHAGDKSAVDGSASNEADATQRTGEPEASAPLVTATGGAAGWFTDATERLGLTFVHDAGITAERHLPETMGAGAALLDANGDGRLDVYFVQSGPMPVGDAANRTDAMPANELFLGDAGGTFRPADCGEGAHPGYGMGVAAGDVDGDGSVDLYVTNLGPDALLRGRGDGRFDDATARAGIDDPRWTAGSIFFDADLDGDLDLYVTGYLEVDVEDPAWCGDRRPGWRSYCHPDHYAGVPDRFWSNRGDGTFVDATRSAGFVDVSGKGLGVIAADLDGDGDLDLYVANDSVENKLWRNEGDGTFLDDTLLTGTGVNRNGATEAGMGLAVGDPDGDLDLDLFVTNFDDESNTLYRNDGQGLFTDATIAFGLDAPSRLPVGFGCVWEDLDLDGDLDLAVANGHIIHNIELYHDGKTHAQVPQLFEQAAGRFRTAERPGDFGGTPYVGRGLYAGDLDGDGAPDLLLTQCDGPARAFRNERAGAAAPPIQGLPPGTLVEATLADGTRVLRQLGGAISYFGLGEAAVRLPAGAHSVRVRPPGEDWRIR